MYRNCSKTSAPRQDAGACAEHFRQSGPNGLEIDKETTHVIVRWTQVDGVTLHDGTPRSHKQDVFRGSLHRLYVDGARRDQ